LTTATIATTPKNTTPTTFRSISGFALPSVIHGNQPLPTALCGTTGTSLGSIPLSTLHVDHTSNPLALAGSSHKKGPDALRTCRTTLLVITLNLIWSRWRTFSHTRTTPRSINLKQLKQLHFFIAKKSSGLTKSNKVNQTYRKNKQNHPKPESQIAFFSYFGLQF